MASFSERKSISEPGRKSGLQNFALGFRQIVPKPTQLDQALVLIKHHVSGAPISVPWLSNAARVDKVPLTRFQDELIEWLGRTVDPADTVAASLALLETAFDGYLDLHDEPDALDLITRTFRRVAQRRRGALQ